MGERSLITQMIVGILYPFMLLLGFYLILNGHYTPGGGFQGGSTFAMLFVARYVVFPVEDISTEGLHLTQRVFLALILLVPLVVLFTGLLYRAAEYSGVYLMFMDLFIGLQVGFGLGVAVFRFAFFRGVGRSWRF